MATQTKQATDFRTSEEVLDEAKDFLEQYFIQLK
jgi:hypothetical protein